MNAKLKKIIILTAFIIAALLTGCGGKDSEIMEITVIPENPLSDFEYEEIDGGIVITKFIGNAYNGIVSIPYGVVSIGYSAFAGHARIVEILLPDSMTTIGASAFENCTRMTDILIPDSVTSVGSRAFLNTAWLDNHPDGLLYIGTIAYRYFGGMPQNTHITIREGTTEIAAGAFRDCEGLTSISLPDSVTMIAEAAFFNCTGLREITLPDNVIVFSNRISDDNRNTRVVGAFRDCRGLVAIYRGESYHAMYKGSMTTGPAILFDIYDLPDTFYAAASGE